MNAVAPVAARLDPLIRRLASDRDGEVIACVRAISRQLGKAGASWHDLADRLTTAPDSAADSDVPPVSDYAEAVEWLLAADAGELTARDIDFLESMRGILRRFEPRPKQAAWIRGLVERLGGEFHE